MERKKKPRKGKRERISLSPADEAMVASWLQSLADTDPRELTGQITESPLALALIERLPLKERSVPVLVALHGKFGDKNVRKAVKRTLFKLRQKGISVPDVEDDSHSAASVLQPVSVEAPIATVGAIGDLMGSRPVVVIIDRAAKGQDLGIGLVSDEEGISQFLHGNFSRRKVNELIESIMEGAGPLVETTLAHALTILETAYRQHQEHHPEIPTDYLEIRPWLLDHAAPLDHPIIYDHIPRDSLPDEDLTDSQVERLLEHEFLKSWLVDFEQLRPYMEDMGKADGSPIVLTEAQKAARIQEIKEKSLEELFPAEKRTLLRQRLEETSYLYFRLNDEAMARLCLQAAQSMDQKDSLSRKNPVVTYLLERSLRLYMKTTGAEAGEPPSGEDSSRIVVP
jgi:hypothetical protein